VYQEKATGLYLPNDVKTSGALRREAAGRAVITALNSGYSHYGANRTSANMKGWNAYSGSAKEDIEDNLDLLRQRSRDAYMGIPAATAALKTLRTNVIAGGLMPSPQIDGDFLGLTTDQVERLQAQILREFSLWADTTACDADRVDDFYGLQQLAFLSALMNGDAFAALTLKPRPGQPYDLRVRLIEADRVCSPNYQDRMTPGQIQGRTVASVVQGVETDEDGEVIAYWVANRHPRSYTNLKPQDWKRVEVYGKRSGMRNILHVMQRERAGQRRGVPILAPVLETLKQLERYADAETTAALLGAIFTVFVQKGSVTDEGAFGQMLREEFLKRMTGGWERDPNDLELGSGLIMDLEMGESVDTVETQHPHSGYDTFMMARMKQVGAALEVPVEVLFKQFTTNFSSARGALNEFWRTCGMQRDWFAEDFCQPIYEMWFSEAVARGRIDAPGFFDDPAVRKAYSDCKWNGPARTALNPSQEVEAAMKRVQAGFATAAEETAQLTGGDYNRNIRQRLLEAQRKREVDEASGMFQDTDVREENEKWASSGSSETRSEAARN